MYIDQIIQDTEIITPRMSSLRYIDITMDKRSLTLRAKNNALFL